jgi:hypothetical protein
MSLPSLLCPKHHGRLTFWVVRAVPCTIVGDGMVVCVKVSPWGCLGALAKRFGRCEPFCTEAFSAITCPDMPWNSLDVTATDIGLGQLSKLYLQRFRCKRLASSAGV